MKISNYISNNSSDHEVSPQLLSVFNKYEGSGSKEHEQKEEKKRRKEREGRREGKGRVKGRERGNIYTIILLSISARYVHIICFIYLRLSLECGIGIASTLLHIQKMIFQIVHEPTPPVERFQIFYLKPYLLEHGADTSSKR